MWYNPQHNCNLCCNVLQPSTLVTNVCSNLAATLAPMSHNPYTNVIVHITWLLHQWHQPLHQCHVHITQPLYQCHVHITQPLHQCHQLLHQWHCTCHCAHVTSLLCKGYAHNDTGARVVWCTQWHWCKVMICYVRTRCVVCVQGVWCVCKVLLQQLWCMQPILPGSDQLCDHMWPFLTGQGQSGFSLQEFGQKKQTWPDFWTLVK